MSKKTEWTEDDELDLCFRAERLALEVARRLDADPRTRTDRFAVYADGSRDMPASTRIQGVLTLLFTRQPAGWRQDTDAICDAGIAEIEAREARGRRSAASRAARARITARAVGRAAIVDRATRALSPVGRGGQSRGVESLREVRRSTGALSAHNARPVTRAELRYDHDGVLLDPITGERVESQRAAR